ncbi:MAG TPA: hypothetical protein VFZ91_14355 [Allosphingosinicella sp.]
MNSTLVAILLSAAAAPAPPPATLPDEADAADAYNAGEIDNCRALIDVCDGGAARVDAEDIEKLRCRPARGGKARCRFRVGGAACTAHFVSAASGDDYGWAGSWSNLPAGADQGWRVAWTRSPKPRGPRVGCE